MIWLIVRRTGKTYFAPFAGITLSRLSGIISAVQHLLAGTPENQTF